MYQRALRRLNRHPLEDIECVVFPIVRYQSLNYTSNLALGSKCLAEVDHQTELADLLGVKLLIIADRPRNRCDLQTCKEIFFKTGR